jgi:hypothetical protein
MGKSWDYIKEQLETLDSNSPSWKSDKQSLVNIFTKAEELGLDPSDAEKAQISKLRVIIKEAKKASTNEDDERLAELFHMAATMPIIDLRHSLGLSKPEIIVVKKLEIGGKFKNIVELRPDQLEKIKALTRQSFTFETSE